MTKIKLCGLRRTCEVAWAGELRPDYVGFVLAPGFRRTVSPAAAAEMKAALAPGIRAVGVFVDPPLNEAAALLNDGVVDIAQLHGHEDDTYIERLRALSGKPVIKAFRLKSEADALAAQRSAADLVLLDSGTGTGQAFNWAFAQMVSRPYLLAGGLNSENVVEAVRELHPWGVDVSSGIETDGAKDRAKMAAFAAAVRAAM